MKRGLRNRRLEVAQNFICAICGGPMPDRSTMSPAERARAWREGLSVSTDHVYPKSSNVGLQPNTVAAHIRCNSLKGNRMPTGCELIWLEAVNARLGREA